jgi:nicotinic acid phosphoribosyltransferase
MRMNDFLDFCKEENMALFTDFYELTMSQAILTTKTLKPPRLTFSYAAYPKTATTSYLQDLNRH